MRRNPQRLDVKREGLEMFMKSLLGVIAAGGVLLTVSAANATVATYTTASAYTAFAGGGSLGIQDNVDWGVFSQAQGNQSVNNSTVNNNSTMSTSVGEKITATNGASTGFTVYTNGLSGDAASHRWDGSFANGTNVLSTSSTTITLKFNGAITGFGIDAQTSSAGAYGFTIQAYNAAGTLLGTAANSGTSPGRNTTTAFGTAPFAGLTSNAGDISYVTITATGANTGLGFAIDTSLIYHFANNQTSGGSSSPTPEPGTLALLGAGLAALGAVRRRRQRA
jgi:hypothetical protein